MKRILKTIKRLIVGLLIFIIIYIATAYLCTFITINNDFKPSETGIEIFIISNGVHSDICIPLSATQNNWNEMLNFDSFQNQVNNEGYLSCGWGDKGFYLETPTWGDLTFSTAVKAMFLPSPTAMHITTYNSRPKENEHIKSIKISKEQFQLLEQYIFDHFECAENKAQLIDCCRYDGYNDNFYEAKGSYSLFRTCNNWTNQALKHAQIKTAVWAPFDKGILSQFE